MSHITNPTDESVHMTDEWVFVYIIGGAIAATAFATIWLVWKFGNIIPGLATMPLISTNNREVRNED